MRWFQLRHVAASGLLSIVAAGCHGPSHIADSGCGCGKIAAVAQPIHLSAYQGGYGHTVYDWTQHPDGHLWADACSPRAGVGCLFCGAAIGADCGCGAKGKGSSPAPTPAVEPGGDASALAEPPAPTLISPPANTVPENQIPENRAPANALPEDAQAPTPIEPGSTPEPAGEPNNELPMDPAEAPQPPAESPEPTPVTGPAPQPVEPPVVEPEKQPAADQPRTGDDKAKDRHKPKSSRRVRPPRNPLPATEPAGGPEVNHPSTEADHGS